MIESTVGQGKESDLISRQAAIDEAVVYIEEWNNAKSKYHKKEITRRFQNLPSVQPEHKRGRWIHGPEVYREYVGTALVMIQYSYWECSICGYRIENEPLWNFCPICGMYNKGEKR